jgi:hypothetical protein
MQSLGFLFCVTIKFPNWCYYSNTTNTIYQEWLGLVRENVYLYDMQVSAYLVDAYEDYSCFGEVSCFIVVEGFKMEQIITLNFV